jgi:hypothetical protein
LLAVPKVRFKVGMVYTMVIIGRAQGSPPLEAFLIEEQFLGSPSAVVRH